MQRQRTTSYYFYLFELLLVEGLCIYDHFGYIFLFTLFVDTGYIFITDSIKQWFYMHGPSSGNKLKRDTPNGHEGWRPVGISMGEGIRVGRGRIALLRK